VSDARLAIITDSGTLSAMATGAVTVTAIYETYKASVTFPIVEAFSGLWRGKYRVESCARLTGAGPSFCQGRIGLDFPLELTVVQNGRRVTGRLNLYSNLGRLASTGAVQGTADLENELHLTAALGYVEGDGKSQIDDWRSRLLTSQTMSGSFTLIDSFANAFGPQTGQVGGRFDVAERVEP
jgi:hypothetical protein